MLEERLIEINAIQIGEKQSRPRKGDFEKLVAEAVDYALSSLGNSKKQTIYSHLRNSHHLSKRDIPFKVREFAFALEETLGPASTLIEIEIMKALHEKAKNFKYFPVEENLSFVDYVETLRSFLRFA
jgi:hypothetical protein